MTKDPDQTITNALAAELGEHATAVENELDEFYAWMRTKGKNPNRHKPLSPTQSSNYHSRIDQLYRFVIEMLSPTSKQEITHEQADEIIKLLDRGEITTQSGAEYSEASKRKFSDTLEKYFTWRFDIGATTERWAPRIKFVDGEHQSADKLNFEERWRVLQAAQDYGSLPSFYQTDSPEREKINGLVAQRLGKPKEDITSSDWDRADASNKVCSLVATTLDTGLIPIEVGNARVDWYDQKRNVLVIPTEAAAKNRPTAELPLSEKTGEHLSSWIQERRHYEAYDGTNRLWLNSAGNPYNSPNLCYLIRRLCEDAGIDHEDRKIVWYSLRHNLGQSIEEEEDLSEARDQLRHEHITTTKNFYGESTVESRRHTLEQVNETARKAAEDPNFSPYDDSEQPRTSVSSHVSETSESTSSGHKKHVDVEIDDTQEARVDLVRKILSDED